MKTYAIAQACDKHQHNRLVDRISGKAQSIIDWYNEVFRCDEVLLFKRESIGNDPDPMPKNLLFFEPDKLTTKDIEWLRRHQRRYNMSFIESIQYDMDKGNLGIFCGICISTVKDREDKDRIRVCHKFIIELRHVYDI